jgi:hypothetical protein
MEKLWGQYKHADYLGYAVCNIGYVDVDKIVSNLIK